jgi:hypothetical protein
MLPPWPSLLPPVSTPHPLCCHDLPRPPACHIKLSMLYPLPCLVPCDASSAMHAYFHIVADESPYCLITRYSHALPSPPLRGDPNATALCSAHGFRQVVGRWLRLPPICLPSGSVAARYTSTPPAESTNTIPGTRGTHPWRRDLMDGLGAWTRFLSSGRLTQRAFPPADRSRHRKPPSSSATSIRIVCGVLSCRARVLHGTRAG